MSSTQGKIIKCQAAVAWETNKPLVIEEIEVEPPKKGEVRIKIVATGVCHTDSYFLDGHDKSGMAKFPCILGHEGAGIVESIGEDVTTVQPGDHVIPLFQPQCRSCKFCKSSKTNLCNKIMVTQMQGLMPDGTTRYSCKGKPIYHFFGISTFTQYGVAPEISVAKVNDKAPLDKICLLGCGVSTGYGAALNTAKVEPGSVVGIWGLGGVGLAVAMGCKAAGASRIIGIDINPSKFEVGKKFGITEFLNPSDQAKPIAEVLVEMTDGGLDYAFECVGNVNIAKTALEACHNGWGETILIGVPKDVTAVPAETIDFLFGKSLKGTYFGGWKSLDAIPKLVEDYLSGKILLDEFISLNLPLQKINEAFERLHKGEGIRTIINL